MIVGVSTACLYPMLLEDSTEFLLNSNVKNLEVFFNTDSEISEYYIKQMQQSFARYNANCISVHPYTCGMESMMLFGVYERRVGDFLEYYKKFFNAGNILGAKYFILHGNNSKFKIEKNLYFERFLKLCEVADRFNIKVLQENVSLYDSASLDFRLAMKKAIGAEFVLDIKQCIRAGENPIENIIKLADSVKHIHFSDHDSVSDCKLIGEGEFDVTSFLQILKEQKYQGALILELYRHNFGDANELIENYTYLNNLISEK
ncbi:MAG: sugar phosphate isomerase/epimerase [Ruminococcus sp.]|jgi:sugar phosphate isomerase/epimerase|nr:sugar phosphate isomerase/epimerase [Ruminococcus sp.]